MKSDRHVCSECQCEYEQQDRADALNDYGVPFSDLPEGWQCPSCGAGKEKYQRCTCDSSQESCVAHAKQGTAI